jgi:hypothetical protein
VLFGHSILLTILVIPILILFLVECSGDLLILGCSDISAEVEAEEEAGGEVEEEVLEDFIGVGKPYMLQRRLDYAFKK